MFDIGNPTRGRLNNRIKYAIYKMGEVTPFSISTAAGFITDIIMWCRLFPAKSSTTGPEHEDSKQATLKAEAPPEFHTTSPLAPLMPVPDNSRPASLSISEPSIEFDFSEFSSMVITKNKIAAEIETLQLDDGKLVEQQESIAEQRAILAQENANKTLELNEIKDKLKRSFDELGTHIGSEDENPAKRNRSGCSLVWLLPGILEANKLASVFFRASYMPTLDVESPNLVGQVTTAEVALQQTREAMGVNASLLQYLPVSTIRIEAFEYIERPVRITRQQKIAPVPIQSVHSLWPIHKRACPTSGYADWAACRRFQALAEIGSRRHVANSSCRPILLDQQQNRQEEMRAIKESKTEVKAQIQTLENQLAELVTVHKEQELKAEKRHSAGGKKRLRESLSEKERSLVMLGAELGLREAKRFKKDNRSEEAGSEDGLKVEVESRTSRRTVSRANQTIPYYRREQHLNTTLSHDPENPPEPQSSLKPDFCHNITIDD
ncbi:hypothetical protein BDW02DRAFT_580544 [Decorospora gaudefroyi]|uniref:Uncharacterized protein n=1 Tax=Decorospora gaudefroyi TaxID=184978 RepID=A0A6A5KFF0_9PLEO|nr:hypothetical protein BDW02DRAFT_580544 [Decorospora gaudefroyi]